MTPCDHEPHVLTYMASCPTGPILSSEHLIIDLCTVRPVQITPMHRTDTTAFVLILRDQTSTRGPHPGYMLHYSIHMICILHEIKL